MEKPIVQFGLKAVFVVTTGAAALMATVQYVVHSAPEYLIVLGPLVMMLLYVALVFVVIKVAEPVISCLLRVVLFVLYGLCVGIFRLFRKPQPPDDRPFRSVE